MANQDYLNHRLRINARNPDLEEMAREAWIAFSLYNDPPHMFLRSNQVVRREDDDAGRSYLREGNVDVMAYEVTRSADWFSHDRDGNERPDRPRLYLIRDMLARPDKNIPQLRRFSPVPIYGLNGNLLDAAYHQDCGILIAPQPGFSLPELSPNPTRDELEIAKRFITSELLGDFPFTSASEKAHAVAAVVHPFVREMIPGPTPLHLIEKPTPGTGGTLLALCLAYPALGEWISAVTFPQDESEWRRVLLAKLLQHPVVFFLDNVPGRLRLESPALASAITGVRFEDRRIGSSDMAAVPISCLWLAAGNNPILSEELIRRTVRIRLDAKVERPELRTGFRHENLMGWVEANHEWLVWSALVIVQAWISAGCPRAKRTLGMFEPWTGIMGGILDVAGVPGFLDNLADLHKNADSDLRKRESFIVSWHQHFGSRDVGVADLWKLALAHELDLGDKTDQGRRIQLGKLLDSLRDRQIAGFRVERSRERQHAQQYRLRVAGRPADSTSERSGGGNA